MTPAEKKVLELETEIKKKKSQLSALRKKIPLEAVTDYSFTEQTAQGVKKVSLSQLFGNKKELILIHNMGTGCPYCTLWGDGFNGLTAHFENRAAFVMESPNTPRVQGRFKKSRGWKFRFVSSENTSFRRDMKFATKDGDMIPGISVFIKKSGKIYRLSKSVFGPGDNFCVAWDVFDMLPGKALDWEPQFKY